MAADGASPGNPRAMTFVPALGPSSASMLDHAGDGHPGWRLPRQTPMRHRNGSIGEERR
jgi:hypothetical protein